jgi:hypothetical protein
LREDYPREIVFALERPLDPPNHQELEGNESELWYDQVYIPLPFPVIKATIRVHLASVVIPHSCQNFIPANKTGFFLSLPLKKHADSF